MPISNLKIVGGVESVWFYHPANEVEFFSLYGRRVIPTSISLQAWGVKTDLGERRCEMCAAKLEIQ